VPVKLPKVPAMGFVLSLVALSTFAVILSFIRFWISGTMQYDFLIWNLFLAWVPLVFAWLLYARTPKGLVWSWANFGLFAAWLAFLPNAFYLVTDFIHLRRTSQVDILFDIILFSTYAFCGIILGITALYVVHVRTIKRFGVSAHYLPVIVLLLCGFAIYLGRYLRWNSWDIITNPLGLLFDVSSSVIDPTNHPLTFGTTLLFYGFLGLIYLVVWQAIGAVRNSKN
jgi:uncharacterized membrane protein